MNVERLTRALERILADPDRQRAELEEDDRLLADFLRRPPEWDDRSERFQARDRLDNPSPHS